jgi:hypothetical protein
MSNALLNALAKIIRDTDKRAAKYRVSRVTHLADRASALDMLPESRHAFYPLAWLVETGRLSSEAELKILAMSPRDFAERALKIAETLAPINACADAWRAP